MILSNVKDMTQLAKVFGEIGKASDNIRTKAAKDFTADIQAEFEVKSSEEP
jgi:hypothetical protein